MNQMNYGKFIKLYIQTYLYVYNCGSGFSIIKIDKSVLVSIQFFFCPSSSCYTPGLGPNPANSILLSTLH